MMAGALLTAACSAGHCRPVRNRTSTDEAPDSYLTAVLAKRFTTRNGG